MKKLFLISFLLGMLLSATACAPQEKYDVDQLKKEITALTTEKKELQEDIQIIQQDSGVQRYVVTVRIKQSHFTLDLEEHWKDEMNALEIPIPVDKAFYARVEVGTVLDNSFRSGSFWMKGSYGRWDISVVKKEVIK